jgi:hypothetical protein
VWDVVAFNPESGVIEAGVRDSKYEAASGGGATGARSCPAGGSAIDWPAHVIYARSGRVRAAIDGRRTDTWESEKR